MKNLIYLFVFPVAKINSESHRGKVCAHRYDGFNNECYE